VAHRHQAHRPAPQPRARTGAHTATLPWRGGRAAGKGVPLLQPQRRRPASVARRPLEGLSLRRGAHLHTAGGAAGARAGGWDRPPRDGAPLVIVGALKPGSRCARSPGATRGGGGGQGAGAVRALRSGPRTVFKSTSVFACFEPLGDRCSCCKKQNSCAKNGSTPLDRLSEAISCEVLAYLCLREQVLFLTPHIAPASRAIDASSPLSLSGRVKCIRPMLCLSFYEWRCIYRGEQMILALFLEKTGFDRAPGRFADNLFVPKHAKADVLLTTVLGPLRCDPCGGTVLLSHVTSFAFSVIATLPTLTRPQIPEDTNTDCHL